MTLLRTLPWLMTIAATSVLGAEVSVATPDELAAAITNAAAGDVITLSPGTYDLPDRLRCTNAGTAEAPITVRAETLGDAFLRFGSGIDFVEGFTVEAPHWVFENLDIEGNCTNHDLCEHAFHIVGEADFTVVRRSRMHEFNAMIKSNGLPLGLEGSYVFADDVVIEYNEIFNSSVRDTTNPVEFIGAVGGRRWVIRGNTIADFAKGGDFGPSYGAVLKGNSRDGLIERNLVICERSHTGGVRIGLSFGGGGTAPSIVCEDETCPPEHQNGTMRNNIVVNCPEDVCIYLNEAAGTGIYHNTLANCSGIDIRFPESTAHVLNNLLSGFVRERDGGTMIPVFSGNLENIAASSWEAWFTDPWMADFGLIEGSAFVDQGVMPVPVTDDFCASARDDGAPDVGAVEYQLEALCDTTVGGGRLQRKIIFEDGFEPAQ